MHYNIPFHRPHILGFSLAIFKTTLTYYVFKKYIRFFMIVKSFPHLIVSFLLSLKVCHYSNNNFRVQVSQMRVVQQIVLFLIESPHINLYSIIHYPYIFKHLDGVEKLNANKSYCTRRVSARNCVFIQAILLPSVSSYSLKADNTR